MLEEDAVMAGRGFNILDLLHRFYVEHTPKTDSFGHLSEDDWVKTRKIASVCIHVEKAIDRINTFRILPNTMHNVANQMLFVCAVLTNC